MTLKGLATQLECQGVDPGYVQRFDWEKWILTRLSDGSVDRSLIPASKRAKSLVLYLIQEYLRVEEQGRMAKLESELSTTKEDLREARVDGELWLADLDSAESNLAEAKRSIEILRRSLDDVRDDLEECNAQLTSRDKRS